MSKIGIHGAAADGPLMNRIEERLRESLGFEIRTETGGRLVDALGTFWDADFIVSLVSKETAPSRWVREEWQRALWEEPEENGSRVLCVLTGDCRHPELMERRRPLYRFLDARKSTDLVVASLREWIMEVRRGDQPRRFLPGEEALTVDDAVLESWRQRTVEMPGIAAAQGPGGAGKTDLAVEFVRRFHLEFEDVLWIDCAGRSGAETAGDAACLLDVKLTADTESSCGVLRRAMKDRRLLLVLDGADRAGHLELLPEGGWTSAIVTTRMELSEFDPVVLRKRRAGMRREWLEALAVCRKDALWPALLHRMGVPLDGLTWLDRQGGWMRAAGFAGVASNPVWERRHAEAALSLAREDAGEQILPDLFLALHRLLAKGDLSLAADVARRAERIARLAHRAPEHAEILRLMAEAAWEKGETAICDAFARDLVSVLEDMDDIAGARMWHTRISRDRGQQMLLPMELDFSPADW